MKTTHFCLILFILVFIFINLFWIRDLILESIFESREFEWPIKYPEEEDFNGHYLQNKVAMRKLEENYPQGYFENRNITEPIIIWWTPFTLDTGSYKTCKNTKRCYFTNFRSYRNNPKTKALLFYGTDFYLHDLPLPRKSHEEWGLLHEESPKNNYLFSFESIMKQFNHTATFKRESDLPLTTQFLSDIDELESGKYLKSTSLKNRLQKSEGLAPVAYVQSDCYTPSNRDIYVEAIMKHIKVDSYGSCLHNKDLPEGLRDPLKSMESEDFLEFLSNYKFVFAMENAVCNDYVTEKLWRSFRIGSVPIVYGSEKINDLIPTQKSIINIRDYANAADLANYLNYLNQNDTEYESFLSFKKPMGVTNKYLKNLLDKREWGINNDRVKGNFIDKFECLVCERIHKNLENKHQIQYKATKEHYGCPKPTTFNKSGMIVTDEDEGESLNWLYTYEFAYCMQKVFFDKYLPNGIYNFSSKKLEQDTMQYQRDVYMHERKIKDLK